MSLHSTWLFCKGENGEPVHIAKGKLSGENQTKFDSGWQNNAFNQFASDMISLHRSLPDIRDEGYVAVVSHQIVVCTVIWTSYSYDYSVIMISVLIVNFQN